jgi:hypothetical protein
MHARAICDDKVLKMIAGDRVEWTNCKNCTGSGSVAGNGSNKIPSIYQLPYSANFIRKLGHGRCTPPVAWATLMHRYVADDLNSPDVLALPSSLCGRHQHLPAEKNGRYEKVGRLVMYAINPSKLPRAVVAANEAFRLLVQSAAPNWVG